MNRRDFGELVATLRKELSDFVGDELRQMSARMLAERAGLALGTIEAIEQGKLRNIDSEILVKLADALELTTMERKEFYLASIGLESSAFAGEKDPFDLDVLLQSIRYIPLPAFISDHFGDIAAANRSIIRLLSISPEYINTRISRQAEDPAALNLMSIICSPDSGYRTTLGHGWEQNIVRNMLFFRRITLRYRSTARFKAVWAALMKDRTFRQFWKDAKYRVEAADTDLEVYSYRHAHLGRDIRYIASVSQVLAGDGERYVTTYVPANPQVAEVFAQIAQDSGPEWLLVPRVG